MSLRAFIDMGGYGGYVWACYGLTFVVLLGLAWTSRRSLAAEATRALRRSQANQE
jgi:heme exporter protein CcmD